MMNQKTILRYPRLDTVLMVEEFIKKHGGEFNRRRIWLNLPRKVMYQTYRVIISYLLDSGKIIMDRDGKVCWIWNPEGIKRLEQKGLIIR
jgi:hypothetical protein